MYIEKINPVRFEDVLKTLPDINKLSKFQLTNLLEVKRNLEKQYKEFEILYHVAQEYQTPFFESQKKIRLVLGSNQSGKTLSGFVQAQKIALGIDPYHKIKIPNRGRIGTTSFKLISDDLEMHFERWTPKHEIKHIKRYTTGEIKQIKFKNDSVIDILSYQQDTEMWEGWQGHWAFLNEPPPREKYIATLRGLIRNNGIIWLMLTPLSEPWIWRDLYSNSNNPDVECWIWEYDKNKYNTEEARQTFITNLKEDEKEARLYGRQQQLYGLVYKEYKPQVHLVNDFEIPKEWTRFFAMDYHPRADIVCLWLAVDPNGKFYVYDELLANGTIKDIADRIKAKEGTDIIRQRFVDWISSTPERGGDEVSNPTREFARYQIFMRNAVKEFSTGIDSVRQALALDRTGQPGLSTLRKCTEFNSAMAYYTWKEYTDNNLGQSQRVNKQFSHFPDCLRYILVMKPRHILASVEAYIPQEFKANSITGYGH